MTTTINNKVLDGNVSTTNTYFRCTRCRKVKPAEKFGFRRMGMNTIRNQAQCTSCRGLKAA